MEQRLIDANALWESAETCRETTGAFQALIESAPTVDAVPVVHGENITEENEVDQFVCSECGIILEGYIRKIIDEDDGAIDYEEYYMRYCPNCGARMKGAKDADN